MQGWDFMVIIETHKFKTFDEYLASLSKSSRKNYTYAKKQNGNVIYQQVHFNKAVIRQWMDLWGKQLIRGQQRPFAFQADVLNEKSVICFNGFDVSHGAIAYQFVEVIDGYMNCHPVMYEKEKYSKRYLSKFMWFNLLSWAIENKIEIVDLGGGNDDSWREMIKTRHQYPNPLYKWLYVPQEVKENPDKQQNYKVEHDGISKRIHKID